MANRGYKLQEFMAHSGNVNCLNLAKKKRGLLITGGDDHLVNLWSIGNPAALTSLCGHTSPIESVAFDLKEIFVVAGASAGAIKLWDLEEIKMVRSLGGHRSYCTAVEFHPFGEFFASGSKDTNLKIWDIRKKECIHTYKGHTRGISTVRFSPDGRWVVSGGFDNVVKIWDLTAGKLLHDFKLHEGHIRSIDFHPIEFLLATGSADRTVKFWDLETFELIGSSRSESTGVRSITFHPEGRTLFSGMDDSLKIYSWEPIVCHDTVNMGWSTLGDLCIQDGKLLGGSYHQNFVGVWVTDISLMETNSERSKPELNSNYEQRPNFQEPSLQKVASFKRSTSNSSLRCISPDDDTKDIKNIYVDTEGVNPVISRKVGSIKPSRNFSSSSAKEIKNSPTQTQVPAVDFPIKPSGQSITKSFIVPAVVPLDSSDWKRTPKPRKEPTSSEKAGIVTSTKPSHMRRPSNTTLDMERLATSIEMKDTLDIKIDSNFNSRLVADDARDSSEEKTMNTESIAGKCEKLSWSRTPADQKKCNESVDVIKGVKAVKYVNGVAVVRGRTRSLVERFERRENFQNDELQTSDSTPQAPPFAVKAPTIASPDLPPPIIPETVKEHMIPTPDLSPQIMLDTVRAPTVVATDLPPKILLDTFKAPTPVVSDLPDTVNARIMQAPNIPPRITHDSSKAPSTTTPDVHPRIIRDAAQACTIVAPELPDTLKTTTSPAPDLPDTVKAPIMEVPNIPPWTMLDSTKISSSTAPDIPPRIMRDAVQACILVTPDLPDTFKEPTSVAPDFPDTVKASILQAPNIPSRIMHDSAKGPSSVAPDTPPRILRDAVQACTIVTPDTPPRILHDAVQARTIVTPDLPSRPVPDTIKPSTMIDGFSKHHSAPRKISHTLKKSPRTSQPRMIRRESIVQSADAVTEDLMRNHDVFLSTLRSRLTKLQVVGHFLEQNDIKGAINATQKLPDHSVQADLINFLMGKMEILTLDLFLCLLPVLLSLLDSKAERHVNVSLELLIKLVAVFGPVISSTLSAPPAVGVNLQAEQRLECCNQCSILLQQIQKSLPALIRRGGLPAKCALELTLLLQDP